MGFTTSITQSNNSIASIGIPSKKFYKFIIFACWFLYASMMALKSVYAAETVEICSVLNISKSAVSMANNYYFISYAIVQVILFLVAKKIRFNKYLLCTVPFSVVCMFLVAFTTTIEQIYILFVLNGICQASVWTGVVGLLSDYLPDEMLSGATKKLTTGFAIGNVAAYAVSSLFVKYSFWKGSFIFFALVFLIAIIVFAFAVKKASNLPKKIHQMDTKTLIEKEKEEHIPFDLVSKKHVTFFYILNIFACVLINAVYHSLMYWAPNFLYENYNLDKSVSIFISILFPLFNMFGPMIAIGLSYKSKNYLFICLIFMSINFAACALIYFFYKISLVFIIFVFVASLMSGHGIATVFASFSSMKMRNYINSRTYTALTNAAASLSAGVSPVIFGLIVEVDSSWKSSFLAILICSTVLFSALCTINCIIKIINRKEEKEIKCHN